jgi:uncharacterized membrane protein YeiH
MYTATIRIIDIIEILGTIAFAYAGSVSAMKKKLDVFGVLIITFVTAVGGGTIRDLLLGSHPVAWMQDLQIIICILLTYIISLFFHPLIRNFQKTIFWFDTIGLAVFCIIAINKAIAFHLHPIACVAIGTVTGCFGGIIRDVILNEIPYVFRKDIYASACIAGGLTYFAAQAIGVPENYVGWVAGAVIVLIRVLATRLGWTLPLIYLRNKKS